MVVVGIVLGTVIGVEYGEEYASGETVPTSIVLLSSVVGNTELIKT